MLEGYKTKTKEMKEAAIIEENTEKGIEPVPETKTLADILKSPSESAMLGKFMEVANDHELAGRLATGDLNEEDLEKLEEYRENNVEKLAQVESLDASFTPEYMKEFGEQSPEFQKLLNLVGPEKAANALKSQLREVVATDPERFSAMHTSLLSLSEYKSGKMKDLEDKIRDQLKDYKTNIKDEDFQTVMAINDPAERSVELRKKVRGSFGIFRKAADYVSFGKFSKPAAEELSKNKKLMDDAIQDLDGHIEDLGSSLNTMISKNGEVRKAFARELINEKTPKKTPEKGFEGIKNEAKELDNAWVSYRSEQKYESATPADRSNIEDSFRAKMKTEHAAKPAKKGIFARLWASFFNTAVDKKELN